ncbi:NERD domain-containing protein [Paenarthrobacter sp. DKR-5]|uniref:NERD domain-containing protein n=1 Tax=Paenarthrobacter sp. DKR-5 TaxID=2835535 RepID=UPI001BDCD9BF|nr:NERD domain-containing protein [Paenarthrobacter sp. DKR-5]MBT1004041.1 NERD domain-containing protein [Paenarthrobacter sp. DKR-5]
MTAGDGAAEQARLAAERVERLRRELERAERQQRAWAAGAAGEAIVARKLAELEPLGWLALHDVHWPGRPQANLDHVLVGPGGVVVIDAKNWSGEVHLRNGVLYQGIYTRERDTSGALRQAASLAVLLEPPHRHLVQAWLCMVRQPDMRAVTSTGVKIYGVDSLPDAVAALPAILDAAAVKVLYDYLSRLLAGPTSPGILTTASFERVGKQSALPGRGKHAVRRPDRATRVLVGCLGVVVSLFLLLLAVSLAVGVFAGLTHPSPAIPSRPNPAMTHAVPSIRPSSK